MVDKKLSDFGSIQPSDVSDFVVLYLDENLSPKNGRLSFNSFVSMLALLSGNNTFTGDNTFSGDVVFEETATFNKGINGTAARATADASGNNIENTYATKTELTGKVDLNLNNMNPSQSAKEKIVGWGIPDYSASISGITSPYTCPYDMYMRFVSDGGQLVTITVDGVQIAQNSTYPADVWICPYVFKKGSIVTFTQSPVYVCPLLGG